ncbi:hypothetical protein EGH22_19295 [Halomicroarcula sp. F28]|uniref:hypothetical protein n=1 Tax=Haloarcula salinisoli TaxID=2487746 RepID=UPI001C72E3F8|nr:hypothetical protein [Halomicroarcula salinisoli]MBX0288480.1 hypothetical protein [Halomicroarcula salinisoli]
MATTQRTGSKTVGTVDAQSRTNTQSVVDVVTEDLRLTDWNVYCTVSECSEDTIHRLQA